MERERTGGDGAHDGSWASSLVGVRRLLLVCDSLRTVWSPTTTGLPQTLRGAWTLCCLRTHALHQQQMARRHQGLPAAGRSVDTASVPRTVCKTFPSSCWGRSRAGSPPRGHRWRVHPASASGWASPGSKPPSRGHAPRFPLRPLAAGCRSSNKRRGPPVLWGTPCSQAVHAHLTAGPPLPAR